MSVEIKLTFNHAVMNSGKSLSLLIANDNYVKRGQHTVLFSHSVDTRFGEGVIASRLGVKAPSISVNDSVNIFEIIKAKVEAGEVIAHIYCDEVQFYTPEQIEQLSDVVDFLNIGVDCYGLRTNFKGELFPGSKRLIEIADKIEALPHICWCGVKATMNARFNAETGEILRDGAEVVVGAETSYVSVCRKHWKQGLLHNPSCSH